MVAAVAVAAEGDAATSAQVGYEDPEFRSTHEEHLKNPKSMPACGMQSETAPERLELGGGGR